LKKENSFSISSLGYALTAWSLKGFSLTPFSRRCYRFIGKSLGLGQHSTLSMTDINRGLYIYNSLKNANLQLDAQSTLLELGTGWTHFYGIFLRLCSDAKIVLFDVQDNRQFSALKDRCLKLAGMLPAQFASDQKDDALQAHIELVAREISKAGDFEDLYRRLGMNYIVNPTGSLDTFSSNSFDAVFSIDVFEHIDRFSMKKTVENIYRILKPGGISVHQIGLDDHLGHYVPDMPSKNYLRFSDAAWKTWYENKLQYINRLQSSDFLEIFKSVGFKLLSLETEQDPNYLLQHAPDWQFQHYSLLDLKTTRANLLHRKPQ